MKLGSIRKLSDQHKVLRDPNAYGPDPVYWVFAEVSEKDWANVTMIVPGNYNREYPKTFGHYHPEDAPQETYHLIEGGGVLVMQKKHIEGGKWVPEKVDEVVLVKARAGDEIVIAPEWGHSWSNIGKGPLISFDNWRSGHSPADYEAIEKLQGLAYYLVEDNGQVKAVANPNYQDLPEPIWLTPVEFAHKKTHT